MVNLWGPNSTRDIKIQEPDDYLEKKDKSSEDSPQPGWIVNFLQPAMIGVMVACISYTIAQLLRQWVPGWRHHLFIIAPILAALAGYATHQTIQKHYLGSNESLRYQIYELVLIFLLCKISTHLDNTMSEIISQVQGWFTDPKTFFDGETILMFVLSTMAWFSAAVTARDLHNITDPTLYIGEKSPMTRLSTRFYAGGLILLITTAFARVRFAEILQNDNPRVPGLIFNILIYFMLGLFLLGQLNYLRHTGLWRRQRVQFDAEVGKVWLRYSLLFLGLVTLIAFILPTGYTVGLLDLVRYTINLVLFIVNLIFFILSYPVLLLLSLLFRNEESALPLPETPVSFQPPETPAATSNNEWLEIARSIVFWIIALMAVGYVIRGYLRDRSNLLTSLQRIKPVKWLMIVLKNIARLWRRISSSIVETVPKMIDRLRRRSAKRLSPSRKQRGAGHRDRVFFHYLHTLDVAKEEGLSRANTQTPYEYNQVLASSLKDAKPQMARLTEIFMEARYSHHDLNNEHADQSETDAQRIQEALRNLKENPEGFEIS